MAIYPGQFIYPLGQLNINVPKQNIYVVETQSGPRNRYGKIKIWLPRPPITVDLRKGQPFKKLSADQLAYFHHVNPNHPNATIFIHGFNVPFGHYGKEIIAHYQVQGQQRHFVDTSRQVAYQPNQSPSQPPFNPADFHFHYGSHLATLYRDRTLIEQQFSHNIAQLNLQDSVLNGDGAHNWWVHMEHNLNRAAGFNGFNYHYNPKEPQYTRLINVAWSGNPSSVLDYIAIEPTAAKTATALVTIIKQLYHANITINIIAHSAGNIVLIKAMNLLGAHRRYHNSLNQVFLWEAAVPNTVLSPNADVLDSSLTHFWQTNHAWRAAKNIHVLYSRHDNVLGPIALNLTDHNHSACEPDMSQKYNTPGGRPLTKLALSIDLLDHITQKAGVPNAINSAYALAQMFSMPLSTLLSSHTARETVYQDFYQRYHSHNPILSMQPTLAQQMEHIAQIYPRAFNDLSVFIGAYSAIMNDAFLLFLRNPDNQKRLAKLAMQINPHHVIEIFNIVAETAYQDLSQHARKKIHHFIAQKAQQHAGYRYLYTLYKVLFSTESQSHPTITPHFSDYMLHKFQDYVIGLPKKIHNWIEQLNLDFYHFFTQDTLPLAQRKYYFANQAVRTGNEMATLMITIFNTPGAEPSPALGYSGPDLNDAATRKLIQQGKIILVDQTPWLMHHSAMRIPDTAVFEQVYKKHILQSPDYQFGRFQ